MRPQKFMVAHLALCRDYNGTKNVLFMMLPKDDRLGGTNWQDLGVGVFDPAGVLTVDGMSFQVFPDWSVRSQ